MNAQTRFRAAVAVALLSVLSAPLATGWEVLRSHPQNPYILQFRDQPTVLRTFGQHREVAANSGLEYLPYLDVLQRDGMNLTRVFLLGVADDTATADQFIQPWARTGTNGTAWDGLGKWDLSTWNEDYFVRLNSFVQACSDRGIVVELSFFCTYYDDSQWQAGPFKPGNNVQYYGPDNRRDCLRLVDANLLAVQQAAMQRIVQELNRFDNIYFEIQNEPYWNEPDGADDQEVAFHNTMLATIRAAEAGLPNRHLVAHNFPQQAAALSADFDQINAHYPTAVLGAPITGAEALLREQSSSGRLLALDETDNTSAVQTRLECWMFLLGGGGVYDGLDVHQLAYTDEDPAGDNAVGTDFRGTVSQCAGYVENLHLVALRRDLSWLTSGIPAGATLQAMADPGQQYVAYWHHGQSGGLYQLSYDPIDDTPFEVAPVVELPAGSWRAVWTRPADRVELASEEFTHAGGAHTLVQVTYQQDIALRIDRTGPGDTTPPPTPTGLAAMSPADGSIILSWNPVQAADLAFYQVYRAETSPVPLDDSHRLATSAAATPSLADAATVGGTTYHYVVTALDLTGNESAASRECCALSRVGPTANAGADQQVVDQNDDGFESVTLDASASVAGSTPIMSFVWWESGTPVASGMNPSLDLGPGEHVIELVVTDGNNLQSSAEMLATVSTRAGVTAREPLRAHELNPHVFQFRDQPAVLYNFGQHYDAVVDSGLDFAGYLNVLQRDGMNVTRAFLLGFPDDTSTAAEFTQPWLRSTTNGTALDGLGKWDFSVWNEDYFTRLTAFVQACSDRDIVAELSFFCTFYNDTEWQASPFNPANNVQGYGPDNRGDCLRPVDANLLAVQQAAVRRIVNKLNRFDNLYYEVQNEPFWNDPDVADDQEVAFHNTMLATIRAAEAGLPNRHLVAHNFPQQAAALSADFDLINEHYPAAVLDTPIAGAEALLRDQYDSGRVLALDETDNTNAVQTRLECWMFLLGGGAVYDGLDVHQLAYTAEDPSGDNAAGRDFRGTVSQCAGYVENLHLVALRRDLSWLTSGIPAGATLQAMADPGQQYVAYWHHGQSGGSFQLSYDPIDDTPFEVTPVVELPAGNWRAVWTRPADLTELATEEFTHEGGTHTLAAVTYQQDIALRIDRTGPGDATPPPTPGGLVAVSPADGSIILSWNPVQAADLAFYQVYRAAAPPVPLDDSHRLAMSPAATPALVDAATVAGTTYHYVVTALDLTGNESAASREAVALSRVGPTASAGPDQQVVDQNDDGVESVTLDASASVAGSSPIMSFVWWESGTPVASGMNPTLDLGVGEHLIELVVTDGNNLQSSAEMVATVAAREWSEAPTLAGTPGAISIRKYAKQAGSFVLERSPDLNTWERVSEIQLNQPGPIEFHDPPDSGASDPPPATMFYRIGLQSASEGE